MHTPQYIQSLLTNAPIMGQQQEEVLIVHPLTGLADGTEVPAQVVILASNQMTVGRHPSCYIEILDTYVSRVHATITRQMTLEGLQYQLQDGMLQGSPSSNGIWVNGERLQGWCFLKDGDWIQFGTRVFSSFHQVRIPTPAEYRDDELLAETLLEAGLISDRQLEAAHTAQLQSSVLLGEVLVQQQHLSLQTLDFMKQRNRIRIVPPSGIHSLFIYLQGIGTITEVQLNAALKTQKQTHTFFGKTLVEQGLLSETTQNFFLRLDQRVQNSVRPTFVNFVE